MDKETRKAKIIDVAWELLKKEGIDGFSMRKLSEASKTTISSLYHYYQNKESIFQAMIKKAIAEINFPIDAINVEDKLKQYGYNILHTLEKFPGLEWLLMVYPPIEVHYMKLLDNLLMIVEGLNVPREYKFYFVNIYMNFILTFQIDRLYQMTDQQYNNQNINNLDNSITPYLNFYYQQNMFKKLGTTDIFEFGLDTLIAGLNAQVDKIN
jgi:TetR/AcrR family tetracycline transcriptional repressor